MSINRTLTSLPHDSDQFWRTLFQIRTLRPHLLNCPGWTLYFFHRKSSYLLFNINTTYDRAVIRKGPKSPILCLNYKIKIRLLLYSRHQLRSKLVMSMRRNLKKLGLTHRLLELVHEQSLLSLLR